MIIPCTPYDVREINGSTAEDIVIQPFINAAVLILTQVEPCMDGKGLSDATKTSASAYLAAHLMSICGAGTDTRTKANEKFENYSVTFVTGNYDSSGILSSPYGGIANALTGGCLQEIDKRNSGVFFAGGA